MSSNGSGPGTHRDSRAALGRASAHLFLGLIPIAAVVTMLWIANGTDSIAADFHNEIYPQAKLMLAGEDPYPEPGADLTAGGNYIWPPLPVLVASPLTVVPQATADLLAVIIGLAAFAAALWIVGVRDWRVYGASFLWPQVLGDVRVAHYSLILCLVVAIGWRTLDRSFAPGLAIGLAVGLKFFLWPLIPWLAAMRRYREAALACGVSALSLLLLVPFTDVRDYVRVLRELGATFDQDSFTPYGLLVQAGSPSSVASVVTLTIGLGLFALAWRRRSLALFIGVSLVLSPIVWLDYFALLAIPLAIVRPRFNAAWLLPVATWGIASAGKGIGDVGHSFRVLVVFGVLLVLIVRAERRTESIGDAGAKGRSNDVVTVA